MTTPALAVRSATVTVPVDLLHRLLVAATVDGKTGVLSNAAWHSLVTAALAHPAPGPAWGLLLVDLDGFAAVNTAHGHPAADEVLARLADVLRAVAGTHGIVGRFGGDEFVALVPARTHADLQRAGDGVRLAVAALVVEVDGPVGRVRITGVTASVGAALHEARRAHEPAAELAGLLWAADTALYAAKHAGGDAVRTAPVRT